MVTVVVDRASAAVVPPFGTPDRLQVATRRAAVWYNALWNNKNACSTDRAHAKSWIAVPTVRHESRVNSPRVCNLSVVDATSIPSIFRRVYIMQLESLAEYLHATSVISSLWSSRAATWRQIYSTNCKLAVLIFISPREREAVKLSIELPCRLSLHARDTSGCPVRMLLW